MRILLLVLLVGACSNPPQFPKSDHFDGEKFHNIPPSPIKGIIKVIEWRIFGKRGKWKSDLKVPRYKKPSTQVKNLRVTFINHATFLLETPQLNILTDPIWSMRAGPFSFAGPKRAYKPAVEIDDLPKIDLVILSHNHYDHMDIVSLKKIYEKFNSFFIVPLGDKKLLESNGIDNVLEKDWWEKTEIKNTKITFTPCRHWSARSLFDRNESLWGGYVIENDKLKIHFAGDTGYGDHFQKIFEKFGKMNLSLLPIGAYEPRDFMREQHMNPAEAVKAHKDLQSEFSIGMHFGTFQLTDEDQTAPERDLRMSMAFGGLKKDVFVAPFSGQVFNLDH